MILLKKFSGAGNTFFIVNGEAAPWIDLTTYERSQVVYKICEAYDADGFLFLHKIKPQQYKWDFFNRDGSTAEMCGNAARCAMAFLSEQENESAAEFVTLAGSVHAVVDGPLYKIIMPVYKVQTTELSLEGITGMWVDTGVPHYVIPISDFSNYKSHKVMAAKLRSHEHFYPKGTNVTYFEDCSDGSINAVTFERGVEDFTLACGTGAVAAALFQYFNKKHADILVKMPGGNIRVLFEGQKQSPVMLGGAERIAEVNINLKDLL